LEKLTKRLNTPCVKRIEHTEIRLDKQNIVLIVSQRNDIADRNRAVSKSIEKRMKTDT
jgi:hypothetical protein